MRFALVNSEKVEAAPKLKGFCAVCGEPATARCGKQRVWHWSHKAKVNCDRWWETETEWHRSWKDKFPKEWQEKILYDDKTGEKHIADVRTGSGLVVEFQNSPIDPQERSTREHFYGNMVWVMNAARLKSDYPRFLNANLIPIPTFLKGFSLLAVPKDCFPAAWIESSVPVFFDFRGVPPVEPTDTRRELLWCLFPNRADGHAVVAAFTRETFVESVHKNPHFFSHPAPAIVQAVTFWIYKRRREAEIKAKQDAMRRLSYQNLKNGYGRRRSRRL